MLGLALGVAVFAWWLEAYGPVLGFEDGLRWGWLAAGFLFMIGAPFIQVWRTCMIFDREYSELLRPVLTCHGLNSLLPAFGDMVEIGWLSTVTGWQMREVVARGLVRMLFTVGVTLGVVGLVSGFWILGLLGVLLPLVALGTSNLWWAWAELGAGDRRWRSLGRAPVHFGLALLQLVVEALAFICVAWALSLPVNFPVAIGLRSVVEWTTYLPVPLSGIGLHHAGITEFSDMLSANEVGLASHAILHHGVFLLSALAVGFFGWFIVRENKKG